MPQATVETKIGLSFNFDIDITVNGEMVQIGEPTIEVQRAQPETTQPPKTKKKKQSTGEVWEQLDLLDPPTVNPVSNVVGALFAQEVLFKLDDEPIKAKDTRKKKPKQKTDAGYAPEPLPFDKKVKASPGTSAGGATSAVITPQTVIDRYLEIGHTGPRNEALVELAKAFSEYRGRQGYLKQIKLGKVVVSEAKRAGVVRKRNMYRRRAQAALNSACGECALAPTCPIKNDFPRWGRIHHFADQSQVDKHVAKHGEESEWRPDMETREAWLIRLLEDPEAPCLPPA